MKKGYGLSLFGLVLLFTPNAWAQLKVDFMDGGSEIVQTIQEKVGEVTNKLDTSAKNKEAEQKGDNPLKTNFEKLKALKQKITDTVDAGKEAYNNAKKKVEGYKEQAEGLYNQANSAVEQGKGMVSELTGTYEENMEKLESAKPKSSSTLTKEINQIDEQLEARKEVLAEELRSKIEQAKENDETLRQLYDAEEDEDLKDALEEQIAQNDALRQQYEADLNSMEEEDSSYLNEDEEYQNLMEEKDQKQETLENLKTSLLTAATGLGAMAISALTKMSKQDKKAAYGEVVNKNFLPPDKPTNAETVAPIVKERQDNFKKDLANAMARLISFRKLVPVIEKQADTITENAEGGVDTLISKQNLLNALWVLRLKFLHSKVALEVAYFKLKTSQEMREQDYRLKNPDKDITSIDLDSYIFTKDQIKSDSKKDASQTSGVDLKNMVGDVKDKATDAVENAQGKVEDAKQIIQGDLVSQEDDDNEMSGVGTQGSNPAVSDLDRQMEARRQEMIKDLKKKLEEATEGRDQLRMRLFQTGDPSLESAIQLQERTMAEYQRQLDGISKSNRSWYLMYDNEYKALLSKKAEILDDGNIFAEYNQ